MSAPWLDDGDVRLYHGDVCDVLASLPAGSVQTGWSVTAERAPRMEEPWKITHPTADADTSSTSTGSDTSNANPAPARRSPNPWLDDGDVCLLHGDAAQTLARLPASSAQTCVTSPPYFGLRDYGTPGQIGLEPTLDDYVEALVGVFREVRRVLRDDGTVWLNLGDSYNVDHAQKRSDPEANLSLRHGDNYKTEDRAHERRQRIGGLKPKDLCGVPWRVAFALQADGWYLRSDIIWAKPNQMPESVTDRPTKAHEYVFLLSKRPKYYWDADAIRETSAPSAIERQGLVKRESPGDVALRTTMAAAGLPGRTINGERPYGVGRNARSVWEIATQPFPMAHFATFPEELARRCILAGSSEAGECSACGTPWQRQVEHERLNGSNAAKAGTTVLAGKHDADPSNRGDVRGGHDVRLGPQVRVTTTGWAASCTCGAPAMPQLVLDPFVGSGTTALVARHHGRRSVGIDLSAEYLGIAARRLSQLSLLSEGARHA